MVYKILKRFVYIFVYYIWLTQNKHMKYKIRDACGADNKMGFLCHHLKRNIKKTKGT